LGTLVLKKDLNTGQTDLSIPFYLHIDKSVVIIMSYLLLFWSLDRYVSYLLTPDIIHHILNKTQVTLVEMLPKKGWAVILFFIDPQLCLLFPYIAVSKNINPKLIWENIKILRGNRTRIWFIQVILYLCLWASTFIISLYWLGRGTPLAVYHGN